MTKTKKILLLVTTYVLIAAMAIIGTVAYLTDTDAQVNVFTSGNVKIDLWEDFGDNSGIEKLIPATGSAQNGTIKNAVEKEVYVTNTGSEDAYVRVHIAIPSILDDDTDASKNPLHFNYNNENVGEGLWDWSKTTGADYTGDWNVYSAEIDGIDYTVYVVTYESALAAGETTVDAIWQVYLDGKVTNEDIARYTEVLGKEWKVYVAAEAAQAAGFDDAYAALNTAFGVPGSYDVGSWTNSKGITFRESEDGYTVVSSAEGLLNAIASANDGDKLVITEDITVGAEDIVVDKSLSFVGHDGVTLTDSVFVVASGTDVSFDNIDFEGRSYILCNKLDDDASISVTNCNITMSNTTAADNRNNMKVAFVSGAGETYGEGAKGLKVVFNNNTFVPGTNNASSPVAFSSWANLADGSEFIGNTFGSVDAPIINGFAIKSANAMDGATITVADNVVYLKTGAWTYLQAFDFFQNCSRDSAYNVVSENNTVFGDTSAKEGSVVYFVFLEGNTYTNVSFTDTGSTLNGAPIDMDDVRQSAVKGTVTLN